MSQARSLTIGLGALAVAALALVGCSSTPSGTSTSDGAVLDKSTKLVVGDIAGDLEANLTAAGQYADVPYDLELAPISDASTIYASLAADQMDVGVWGLDANGLLAIQNGAKVKIVAIFGRAGDSEADQNQGLLDLIVRKGVSIADLKGKGIATSYPGITPDVVLTAGLASVGLTQSDVDVQRYPDATSQVAAFLEGKVDAIAGSVQNKQIIDLINSGEAEVAYWQDQATTSQFLVAVPQAVIDDPKKSAALSDFVQRISYFYAWRSVAGNADAFAAAIAQVTKTDAATAEQIVQLNAGAALPLPFTDENVKKLQGDLDLYLKWGYLKTGLTTDQLIDKGYTDAVQAGLDAGLKS